MAGNIVSNLIFILILSKMMDINLISASKIHMKSDRVSFRQNIDDLEHWLEDEIFGKNEATESEQSSISSASGTKLTSDTEKDFRSQEDSSNNDALDFKSSDISDQTLSENHSEEKGMNFHDTQNSPVEEILYIRRSNSENQNDFLEFVESSLFPKDDKHKIAKSRPTSSAFNDDKLSHGYNKDGIGEEQLCNSNNFNFSDSQICPSGSQYSLRYWLNNQEAKNYDVLNKHSEEAQHEMEVGISTDQEEFYSRCEYHRTLGPEHGPEHRALCPFQWTLMDKNSSRIPEVLLTAKCSCQISRLIRGQTARCVELKQRIPVLWRVDCNENSHVFQEGWEEINVACVPVGREVGLSKLGNILDMKTSD